MKKSLILMIVTTIAVSLSIQALARDAQEIYNKTCAACHAAGAAGAPKTGDVAAWRPRLDKGMPALLASANNGTGAMPPKGLCMDCTDEEFTALIKYMSTAK
ncbi:Cytochrome C oxidase, cbb3-type, subunit III [Shewanella psychrophila]|uniref:Cytochrome C oxidase, cbb3-type, subunit III n=1 Tax=Shewanella psychrophila TaxID=225848 RepID=A0A1S6HXR2_9GAMM|nr:c-type cytochrome [Shewanella psychrophila]AQS40367.1 Cytochrome C oxidase, cbb3-type, subunit III [Shewanella psychrophila]